MRLYDVCYYIYIYILNNRLFSKPHETPFANTFRNTLWKPSACVCEASPVQGRHELAMCSRRGICKDVRESVRKEARKTRVSRYPLC